MKKIAIAALLVVLLSACARRVTLDPERIGERNSADWTVKSEPVRHADGAPAPDHSDPGTDVANAPEP